MDDMIVVSEIGEQWSPKIEPQVQAAMVTTHSSHISPPVTPQARGKAIGIMMAVVP